MSDEKPMSVEDVTAFLGGAAVNLPRLARSYLRIVRAAQGVKHFHKHYDDAKAPCPYPKQCVWTRLEEALPADATGSKEGS